MKYIVAGAITQFFIVTIAIATIIVLAIAGAPC
jgi:hypothetical protein